MTDTIVGLVLAAGSGSRYGGPKALVVGDDGVPWLARAIDVLRSGGCDEVVVVLGASAVEAGALLRETGLGDDTEEDGESPVRVVETEHWARGIGESLRAGLTEAARVDPVAVVVTLVDLPALQPSAVERVIGTPHPPSEDALRQAVYDGRPGHPVLIGATHLPALVDSLDGDVGARPYLVAHDVLEVDCTGLGGDDDRDVPDRLPLD
ncbi:hypothetical protein GCM10010988_09750 [Cnuibacter physcomitrellae]|uniref:Uncharacterized protein n=1 Tax=Cnuibacter physcomitrellae TaxID=1619308 RepID=A0A1X9LL44_9MICO|nr:nucleotidyltransferase family protein [Cnuibacter physcomitrellae]ARJ05837.1 hypothetical protein B5808_11825 [Cnuibacter physcomitrellae]GGI36598.1 hypothetical protein GCM10010988_09750 [Cnuibacter physcomitrellae]